jgi:hypothetical protein
MLWWWMDMQDLDQEGCQGREGDRRAARLAPAVGARTSPTFHSGIFLSAFLESRGETPPHLSPGPTGRRAALCGSASRGRRATCRAPASQMRGDSRLGVGGGRRERVAVTPHAASRFSLPMMCPACRCDSGMLSAISYPAALVRPPPRSSNGPPRTRPQLTLVSVPFRLSSDA